MRSKNMPKRCHFREDLPGAYRRREISRAYIALSHVAYSVRRVLAKCGPGRLHIYITIDLGIRQDGKTSILC